MKRKSMRKVSAVLVTAMVMTSVMSLNAVFAEKESGSTGEEVTIRLVHYMGEQSKRDALDEIIEEFSEEYPNIHVDIETVASSNYIPTYKNYIAAGEAPDIFFGKPQNLTEFIEAGYMMDISGEECLTNVLPILVDECTVDGGVYGFPMDVQVKATFYNKKMFEAEGVEVPTTKDEYFAVCDKFMEDDIYPLIHAYNFIHGPFHELDSFFTAMAAATENDSVWIDSQNDGVKLADNEIMVEAMEMVSKMASYKDEGDAAIDQTQGVQNFAAEERPMYINGGWVMGDVIAANPDGEFGMFPTPWSDNEEDNKLWVGVDDVFVPSAQTENKDAVLTFLNYLASDECSQIWMEKAKLMTSNVTASTDDADDFIKEIKQYMDDDKIVSKSLVPDYTSEFSTAFRTKLQEFVIQDDDNRDVKQFLEDVDSEIDSIRE